MVRTGSAATVSALRMPASSAYARPSTVAEDQHSGAESSAPLKRTNKEIGREPSWGIIAMIDVGQERLISISNLPALLPARRNGRRIHVSACYRWVQRGIHGVKLEAIKIGATSYTSIEALMRFGISLNPQANGDPAAAIESSASRRRTADAVSRRVARELGLNPD